MIDTIMMEAKRYEAETDHLNTTFELKAKLSALWTFVLLNMLFRDMHEFFRVGFLEGLLEANASGMQVSAETLFVAALVLELPIIMIVLTWFLKESLNRWANIIIAGLLIVSTIAVNTAPDLDDLFFATMEIVGLMAIIFLIWRGQHAQG